MSSAKGSDKSNKLVTPSKVVATARSEAKAVANGNVRQTVAKAVAMPASAVRAAVASARAGAPAAVRVGYDVISRLLSFLEAGVAIDKATLQLTKAAIDTAGIADEITVLALGKLHAKVVTLNDVLVRIVSFHRTYEETLQFADQPAKTISKTPGTGVASRIGTGAYVAISAIVESLMAADPSLTYEEATLLAEGTLDPFRTEFSYPVDQRVLTVGKNFTETLVFAENISKVVSFVRNYDEIVEVGDVTSFALSKAYTEILTSTDVAAKRLDKTKSEVLAFSDSDKIAFGKAAEDIFKANDADTIAFTKVINDFVLVSDQFLGENGIISFGNSEVNLAAISDQLTKVVSFYRLITEPMNVTEAMSKTYAKPKNDPLVVDQKMTKVVSFNRLFAEPLAATESFLKTVSYIRAFTEAPTASDAFPKTITKGTFAETQRAIDLPLMTIGKNLSETQNASDTFSRLVYFQRNLNSNANAVAMADIVSTIKQYNRAFVELPRATDNFAKTVSFIRSFAETQVAADSFSKTVTFVRNIGEIQQAVDTFVKVVSFNRTVADSVGAAETFTKVMLRVRTFNENPKAADVITAKVISKTLADVIRMSDSLYFSAIVHPDAFPPADTQSITDSFKKVVTFLRSKADSATVAQTDTIQFTKVGGSTLANIWSDFNEILVSYELTQAYNDYRVEWINLGEQAAKTFNKKIAGLTFYSKPVWTDYNELTFGQQTDQELEQEWSLPYTSDTDLASAADVLRKVVTYRRLPAEIQVASDAQGKLTQRTVGDVKTNVFNDFAGLFYTQEKYTDGGGYGATVTVERRPETHPNLLIHTNNLSNAIWTGYCGNTTNTTHNNSTIAAPNGTFTATKITRNNVLSCGASTSWGILYNATGFFRAGTTYTVSFYARVGSGTATGYFGPNDVYQQPQTFTTTWQRYTLTFTPTAGVNNLSRGVQITCYTFDTDFYIWGPQVEYGSVATPYREVGAAPVTWSPTNGYVVNITAPGRGYSVGQVFKVLNDTGNPCTFTVAAVDANGGIRELSSIVGTPTRTTTFSDIVGYSLGTTLDQDLLFETINTYSFNGPVSQDVGPRAQSRHNVIGQELLNTLTERTDGDKVSYTDSSSRFITKVAVDQYPQGFWTDYNELTFGQTLFDQDLTQTFIKSKPTGVHIADVVSKATLGLTKKNTEIIQLGEAARLSIRPRKNDIALVPDVRIFSIAKTVGDVVRNTWTDYQELVFSGLMGVDYGGRYDLLMLPDTLAKNVTKVLVFDTYKWTDYNDLTFATTADQSLTFAWADREYTEHTSAMDFARLRTAKNKHEVLELAETFGKSIGMFGGDGRNASYFRDFLGINPIGEHNIYGAPIMDEELTLRFVPGSKTDFARVSDAAPKTFTKHPQVRVSPYWSDFAELSFATQYDQELVQYQNTFRPETIKTADLFRKIWNISRTFNDSVTVTESMLLSINGGPSFTLLRGLADQSVASEALARYIGLSAGEVGSYYSTWQDFPELSVALELAQYYYRGTDSTLDIGKATDVKKNLFTKQGGRVQNILNFFDTDIYYERDLLQQFAQDYVTEIIRLPDERLINVGKNLTEPLQFRDSYNPVFSKKAGDVFVPISQNIVGPLYKQYLSDYEENLRATTYPDDKTDVVNIAENVGRFYSKQGGMSPVNSWNDYFEVSRSNYNAALLLFGFYGPSNNAFPQTIFDKYLDEIVYEELAERQFTPRRTENLDAVDYFRKTVNFRRTFAEPLAAVSQPSIQFSPAPKTEVLTVGQTDTVQFTKTAGSSVWQVWGDFAELHPFNDLAQNYPDYRIDYAVATDSRVLKPTKGLSETPTATDVRIKKPTKGLADITYANEGIGKSLTRALGDNSEIRWVDFREILSFDPRQMTFGAMVNFKFDLAVPVDARSSQMRKAGGSFKTKIWSDYMEITSPFNELTQYWPDYVTDNTSAVSDATIRLNKQLAETPRSSDHGLVTVSNSDAYVVDTSPYFLEHYLGDGVTASTF